PFWWPLSASLADSSSELCLPIRTCEVPGLLNLHIPALPDHQKLRVRSPYSIERASKIIHQNNVAVDITEDPVPCDRACRGEHVVQTFRALLAAFHVRFVADAEFPRDISGALVVTEKNHLDSWVSQCPALDGIALNNSALAEKRFRRGKEGKHPCLPLT